MLNYNTLYYMKNKEVKILFCMLAVSAFYVHLLGCELWNNFILHSMLPSISSKCN